VLQRLQERHGYDEESARDIIGFVASSS
jgi:hypothetical protein